MSELSSAELATLKQQLIELRARAQAEIDMAHADVEDNLLPQKRDEQGWSDASEANRLGEVRSAEIEIDRATVRSVDNALKRMADGRYGICVDCGEPIPTERLRMRPTSIRCVACKTRLEARQR